MKINLQLPDELFETYVKEFGIPYCYAKMRDAIDLFKNTQKHDRIVILSGDVRRDIEKTFQTTIDTPEKLAKLCRNLNTVKIGGIEHSFSVDELARLDMQATFHGRDRETFIKEMIAEIVDRMLEKV